jgi:hypothetical protein
VRVWVFLFGFALRCGALLCAVSVRLHLVLFPAGRPFLPSLSATSETRLSSVGVSRVARVCLCLASHLVCFAPGLASALRLSAPMLLGVSLLPLCDCINTPIPPTYLHRTRKSSRNPSNFFDCVSAGVLRPALRADVGRVLRAPWGRGPDAARGLGRGLVQACLAPRVWVWGVWFGFASRCVALLCGVFVRLHLALFPAGGPFLLSLSVTP